MSITVVGLLLVVMLLAELSERKSARAR